MGCCAVDWKTVGSVDCGGVLYLCWLSLGVYRCMYPCVHIGMSVFTQNIWLNFYF